MSWLTRTNFSGSWQVYPLVSLLHPVQTLSTDLLFSSTAIENLQQRAKGKPDVPLYTGTSHSLTQRSKLSLTAYFHCLETPAAIFGKLLRDFRKRTTRQTLADNSQVRNNHWNFSKRPWLASAMCSSAWTHWTNVLSRAANAKDYWMPFTKYAAGV